MTQNTPHSTSDLLCGAALERVSHLAGTSDRASPSAFPTRSASPSRIGRWCRGNPRLQRPRSGFHEVALAVEVADSRVSKARGLIPVYGGGGIAVYWIINLVDRQGKVYSRPDKTGYKKGQGFQAWPANPGHDRRPAAPPDRRR